MVTELTIFHPLYTGKFIQTIFASYEEAVELSFYPPNIEIIQVHYNALVETKVIDLLANLYQDDFYDGRPGSMPNQLPDSIVKENLEERIGIPIDIELKELSSFFNHLNMVYWVEKEMLNSPLVNVW